MDKLNLDDIFSDPIFDELIAETPNKQVKRTDSEFEKFQEIIGWIKNHNGKEPEKSRDMTERKLFSRLKGYRDKPEMIKKLAEIDELNLLDSPNTVLENPIKNPESLDDILNDDTLFEKKDKVDSLLDLSRYKRTISAADKYSVRKRASHFEQYEPLFKFVQKEIANGTRRIIPVDSENNIIPGKFYIDNGILLYVLSVGNYYEDKHGYRNAKLHLIYENGTENKGILLRSFASNLFDKTRHGRMVTEVMSDVMGETTVEERAAEYLTTGYIYVVRSLSSNPEISKYQNLYKIGFAGGGVEKRIANAENEATYLYASVKIVATWEVQNFSAQKLETVIHHRFEDKQLQISVPTANGKIENPKEWYLVSLDEIEASINEIIVKLNS
ncbi:GIY-YIG nuclease family protein [Sporosarcina sp. resist]|uniref:GIY-YIG nuclease family protein n=1 Tax=Sporosarcina sp. resist TaxID=2762563 RepID=UPI00164DDFF9|nr:GIY-YIG nuclease family protein [Sporosarcina sp. resist]QNK88922.1 GIY-YIG nuclease family protein [Sporosarcina sp. resist]